MTREETIKIIRIIVDLFPNFKPNDISETVDVWAMMLSDYSYEQISIALKTYISSDTSGFAPSIGQLIDNIYSTEEIAFEQSEYQIWGNVMKAVSNSLYNASVEFSKLDEISQTVLGSPESLRTMAMDSDFNENVSKALFMKSYRNEVERRKRLKRMPEDVKQKLGITNHTGGYIE